VLRDRPASDAGRTKHRSGVAFWVGNRLVGDGTEEKDMRTRRSLAQDVESREVGAGLPRKRRAVIVPDGGGKDVFSHQSAVQGVTSLAEGRTVEFDVKQPPKGPQGGRPRCSEDGGRQRRPKPGARRVCASPAH
jgi:cold shock CspA family protein